ncbi:spermidine synthase [Cohnella yongneupensis]|uniref:Spermidine synthase n=1 Tax=Cohnella yongneupensis TaxID=425006 RepID=A0ABW0R2J5_9BACL
MHILAKETSEYNELTVCEVSELFGEMGKFRCLKFADEAVQGAMDLRNPRRIVLPYQRAVIRLLETIDPSFDTAFIIGHGIGTIAGHYPNKKLVVAEIDEKVVELSRRYFDYRLDNVTVGDGREVLAEQSTNIYDHIVVDAFTHKGTPMALSTLEFFRLAEEKLDPDGTIIMNLFGKPKNDTRINAIHTTLGEVFGHTAAYWMPEGTSDAGNIILVGSNREMDGLPVPLDEFKPVSLEQGHMLMDPR